MATILNDIHIATHRQAGTTPASQSALKAFIQEMFASLVEEADEHLIINGDLFDGFTVDPGEVMRVVDTLTRYLDKSELNYVTLGMGNHDASAKGDKTSSFHLLGYIMKSLRTDQVQVVDHTNGLTCIECRPEIWMIPHMLNQALFDLEIEKALKAGSSTVPKKLLLHCNVMSPFAEHADHSLNLNQAQLDALVDAGWTLIVGHEHQGAVYKTNQCVVTGNQVPSSVSDCLGNKYMKKYYAKVNMDGGLSLVQALDLNDIYAEIDWRKLGEYQADDLKFIRVAGECSSEEAAEMVNVVAKFRQSHDAFVITNAVKVDGVAQMEALAEMSMENVSKFDVLGALMEELNEREQETVKGLLQ